MAALCAVLLALPQSGSADALPRILDVDLDDDNHAVVTWSKASWQGSVNVKWSRDGTLAAASDPSYGAPLADCVGDLRPNPNRDSTWLYGRTCKGDDVPDTATRHVTREEMQVGVYYFQVAVAGENHASGNRCHHSPGTGVSECLNSHYSGVLRLTVTPASDKKGEDEEEEEGGAGDRAIGQGDVDGKLDRRNVSLDPAVSTVSGPFTIRGGDALSTAASPALIRFRDGGRLALDRRSAVEVSTRGATSLFLVRGRIWYSVKSRPRVFFKEIAGNGAFVYSPRAATFTLHRVRANVSVLRVYAGVVTAGQYSGRARGIQRVRVAAGQQVLLVRHKAAAPRAVRRTAEPAFWRR